MTDALLNLGGLEAPDPPDGDGAALRREAVGRALATVDETDLTDEQRRALVVGLVMGEGWG